MTSARFAALLCAQLVSAMAWAQTVSFDLPTTDVVNRSNVAFLAFGGSCSNVGEQVTVSGPGTFSATAQCRDAGRWDLANVSLTHLADGSLTFTARHASTAQASRTLRKDTVAPSLSLQQPTNGSSIDDMNQGALLVRGTCGDLNQPVTVRARPASANAPMVERQLTCPASRSFSTTLDVSGLPDGDTQIFVQHRDAAGNTAQQDIILYKDAVPLLVTFNPLGTHISAQQSATLQLGGTCNKPGNALYLDVTGASGYLASLLTYCGADETWGFANVSVTDAPDEELTFTATLTHALTGGSVSVQVSALKDTAPPVVTVLTPAHGDRVTSSTGTALHVSGACSDATPVSVAVAGEAARVTPCQAGAFSLLYDVAGLPDGDLTLRVLQVDAAGNVGRQDLSLQKDVRPASVSVLQPITGSFINTANAASFRFTGACSEHGSFAEPVLLQGAVSATALCVAGSWSVTLSLTELPEGPLSVRVTHGDTAGNPPAEVLLALTKDVVPPLLQITSPDVNLGEKAIVNASNADTLEVLGSCSEVGRSLQVSGALTGAATCLGGAFTYRPDFQAAPDGDLLLHFTLTDAAGNSATQTLGLFKDVQPPAITLANMGDPLVLNAQNTVELVLSGECTEHGSFATPVALVAPTGALAVCVAGQWSLMLSLSGEPEGTGVLRLEHRDAAGNLAVLERAYVKDTVPPVLSVARPSAGFLVNAGNQHAVSVAGACDEPGRTVTLFTASGLTTAGCEGGAYAATLDLTGVPDGDVLIRARLEDAVGNASVQDVLVYKDVAPPSLTLANVGDPLGFNAATAPDTLLTGTCSEHGSFAAPVQLVSPMVATAACNSGTWALHVSVSEFAEGRGTLALEHTDRAGNRVRLSRAYVKDTVAPLLTLTQPGPGFHVTAANVAAVRVAGTCNEEGRAVELSGPVAASAVCTAGRYQVDVSLSGAPDGDVTLRAKLTDAAGNATVQDVIVHKDTVVPTLTLTSVGDPVVLNAGSSAGLWLMGDCSEHSTPVELVSPVTATAACNGVTWSLLVSLTELPDGNGTLELKHRDVAGNAARLTRAYRKDSVAPLLALSRPAANEFVNASRQRAVQVSGTCNEQGGVVEVTAPVAASTPCSGGAFSLSLDLGSVPDGDVAIRTRLRDTAGNETRQDVLVLKDTVLPTLTLANAGDPLQVSVTPGASLVLSGTCSEHSSAAQQVRLVSPVTATAACNAGAWSLQLNSDVFPSGPGSLELTHADLAGNTTRLVRAYLKAPPVPSLKVTSLAAGDHVPYYPRLEGTCSEQGRSVELLAPITTSTTCWSGRFTLYAYLYSIPDGPLTLRLRHTNAFGNEVILELAVTKDSVAPTLTLTQPASWDLGPAEALTLQGTCSEPGRPVLIKGAFTGEALCAATKTFSTAFPLTTWGTHKVTLEHRDLAGNTATVSRDFERCVYTPQVSAPVVGPSGRLVEADFNADGVRDLAEAVAFGLSDTQPYVGGVRVYLGRAAMSPGISGFEEPLVLSGLQPDRLTVADFNADGALDILVREQYQGLKLVTGRMVGGRPSGTFNPPFTYAHLNSSSVVLAAHVNGDNLIDLVMTGGSTVPDALSVSLGRQACGPGVDFEPQFAAHTGVQYPADATLAAADFNKDGRTDLTYTGYYVPVTVLLRTTATGTQGLFQPVSLTHPTGLPVLFEPVITADLNGDSFMDVAAANWYSDAVTVSYGRGDGTFTAMRQYEVGRNPTILVAADVDADGRQDLLASGENGGITILPGRQGSGPGGYDFGAAVGVPGTESVNGLLVTDVNGDAIPDFVLSLQPKTYPERKAARLVIQYRTAASLGADPFHPAITYGPANQGSGGFATADFDADGILDFANSNNTGISILRGQGTSGRGNGTFTLSGTYPAGGARVLTVADFNEDGARDIAALVYGQVSILLGNRTGGVPNGTFAAAVTYPCVPDNGKYYADKRLLSGDFNGDGVLDLLCDYELPFERTGIHFTVLWGRGAGGVGNGTFDPYVAVMPGVQGVLAAHAGDFNRDGVSDLALGVDFYDSTPPSRWRQEVQFLFGTGTSSGPVFQPPVIHGVASSVYSLASGDFNADGVVDFLPWFAGGGPSSILLGEAAGGLPTGAFTRVDSARVDTKFEYGWGVEAGDYDRDGAADLVVLGINRVQVLRRMTGAPGYWFYPDRIYSLPTHPRGVVFRDFNSDGVLDIAFGMNGVTVMLGRSPTAP